MKLNHMKPLAISTVFLLLGACSGVPSGDGQEDVTNRFPPGWVTGFEDYKDDGDIIEYVPKGETVDNWSQMVTYQTFKSAAGADTEDYLRAIANGAKSACTETKFFLKGVKGKEDGFETSRGLLYCGKNLQTGKGEVTMFKVISGRQALYVGQFAKRTEPFSVESGPGDVDYQYWESILNSFKICRGSRC